MKQAADSKTPSICGKYSNTFEGEGIIFGGSTKNSQKLGTPQEKQSQCPTLQTREWKSIQGSISKMKNEPDDSELQKDNFWIQRSVDYKDKQMMPTQLCSQQSKKRGIRVQSNHKFPSDFFSNQLCQTETSTEARQLTSQPVTSSNSNTINHRISQFQTSSHPMKLSLPLPSDQLKCENEQSLINEQMSNNKNSMNYSSSKGYLIRQMYPPALHQQTQSISSIKNYQQNLHMSINDGQTINNNNTMAYLNQQQLPQAPGARILSPNEGSLRMLSPKERPWRILSPKENSSSNIAFTPLARPLRILSPKEHPACMNSPKTSMIPCNSKTILKPQLRQQLQQNSIEPSSSSLEKDKKNEKYPEQSSVYQNQRQNSCMLGLNAKRMMNMIENKSAEKNSIIAPFSSRPSIQAGMILDRREKLIQGGISNSNTAAGVANNITNSIIPALSRPNVLSAKGNKSNPVDFSNFKMPLSQIGKKIKDFQPPEKSQGMNKTKKNIHQESQENEQAPKNLGQRNKKDDSNKLQSPNRLPQLKMHTTNDISTFQDINYFSEIISHPHLQMTNGCDEYETIEEDFQQVEDSQQNTYLQQHQQQDKSEHALGSPLENKTADFSAGWNANNNNSSSKKDQPRLAVNSKITEKYKPFLIRQVSSQSSQRAQQSSNVSTNTSATAASLTMFCSDLIKNSDVILKNPSLTAQQQPILNSIECFNSHEFSFSNN